MLILTAIFCALLTGSFIALVGAFHRTPAVAGLSEVVCWLGEG